MSEPTIFGDSRRLSWGIELPDRRRASMGQARPRATLIISPSSEDEERFSIPVAVARSMRAKALGGELDVGSRAELLYRVREQEHVSGRARIERLLDRRDYAQSEIRRKLNEDGYGPRVIDELVSRAVEAGLVDDRRYAEVYIRSKLDVGWGTQRIARELRRRGIDVDELEGWPYEFLDPEEELDRAFELARRKHVSGPTAQQKLVRFLLSRGYTTGIAYQAARRVLEEDDF